MNQLKKIKIIYFAALREKAGKSEELIETDALVAEEVYAVLANKYGFTLNSKQLKLSLNENFADMSAEIKHNDELVFIPPVAGG